MPGILERAETAAKAMRQLTRAQRAGILRRAHALLRERSETLARTISLESGKPIREARAEVDRACWTVLFSSEEAGRLSGEEIPLDAAPGGAGRLAMTVREPLGVVAAITPFNFPLNLSMHKVAPALGAGNAVVHKPASTTPLSALRARELFLEAGLPPEAWQILIGSGPEIGTPLAQAPQVRLLTFTGSAAVGYTLRAAAPAKRITLELGNASAVTVLRDADLHLAADACVRGAFANSGQTCISVQRVYVEAAIAEEFAAKCLELTRALRRGHPLEEATEVSSLIHSAEAERVENWVKEAAAQGAEVLLPVERDGAKLSPGWLWNPPASARVVADEVFGPLASIIPVANLAEALAATNLSRYGLQAAIFTRDLEAAWRFARGVEAGGVMINDSTNFRVDLMPYGGVKESGSGREGPRYAMAEMTELKLVSWRWGA